MGEIWSSKRCATMASISTSALMRTSAAVARSTTSSLVNASAPRVLSRRANSWTLIICSLIVGLLIIHRNPRFGRRILRPPCGPLGPTVGADNWRPLRGSPQLIGELVDDDVDSGVLAGFLQALRTADLAAPRLWLRLCWAAWRAGAVVVKADGGEELPADLSCGSRLPRMPYGHPDLLLGRAAAAGLITVEAAELISVTRFGDALIEQLAVERGVTASALRMRRRRAERVVAAAVIRGDVQWGACLCSPRCRRSCLTAQHGRHPCGVRGFGVSEG
ncbi:hypothetical protein [Micromonospora sp. HM134]|uniref:hypothetical protein n=1 Tax=Micromonospora sp. HM134 TaxID=2583243 RepID=UPI001F0E93EF|nr:hypothetical protein [Micromonospora sp. HM134]